MASQQWADDDQLLAALDSALRTARAVPREFVEAGKAAYTWHSIDAELAALTFDSTVQAAELSAVRGPEASPRYLTLASTELTIELEISSDAMVGQIVPPERGQVEACPASGPAVTVDIDEVGCFVIRPLPTSPFRLHCHTGQGIDVLTTWITL